MQAADAEVSIIRLLKADPDGYTSGRRITRELGISRTAVWKHMGALRRGGYSIEASPRNGYRLAGTSYPFNGVEVRSGLKNELLGKELFFYNTLESTNSRALEMAKEGAAEGTVIIAESQTKGRGRLGRTWLSAPGGNLYTSIILRPPIPPQDAQTLTLTAAVGVAETISAFSPVPPTVKWPNDVLIDSKKAAGILTEMNSEADRVNFVIVGIGVNVNMPPPAPLGRRATSIKEICGKVIDRAEFAQTLYSRLEKWYKVYLDEGFAPVLGAWKGYFDAEGKHVKIEGFDKIEGICMGVDEGGALLVRNSSGHTERVISGEVA
jgi:BirA family biotin operon repressor/biotin-[acetyl-CoA-carboxylase] ligase